jgi:hypothetical protein
LTGSLAYGIAANDLDGDAIPDLAVTDDASGTLSILHGDGQGGFKTASSINIGSNAKDVRITDLDGDGIPDLVVSGLSNVFAFLYGKGDGTFTFTTTPFVKTFGGVMIHGTSFIVEDFNGDGVPDLVSSFDTDYPTILGNDPSVSASLDGVSFSTSGEHLITAVYSGDSSLPPSQPDFPVEVFIP